MDRHEGTPPPTKVPFSATPAGEPASLRDWANLSVWTDPMLTTLEQGVRGGRWHTLIDKVYSRKNLFFACRKVVGNQGAPGVDHVTVEQFDSQSREELARLGAELADDTYRPQVRLRVVPVPRGFGCRIARPLHDPLRAPPGSPPPCGRQRTGSSANRPCQSACAIVLLALPVRESSTWGPSRRSGSPSP